VAGYQFVLPSTTSARSPGRVGTQGFDDRESNEIPQLAHGYFLTLRASDRSCRHLTTGYESGIESGKWSEVGPAQALTKLQSIRQSQQDIGGFEIHGQAFFVGPYALFRYSSLVCFG
jgi:hypothetical protein